MIFYPRYFPVAGLTLLPNLMFIRKDCRDNVPLIEHEKTHQNQMRRDGVLKFWFCYLFLPKYRQAYEVEAYRVSIVHGASIDACAVHLAEMYFLGLTFEQAKELLK